MLATASSPSSRVTKRTIATTESDTEYRDRQEDPALHRSSRRIRSRESGAVFHRCNKSLAGVVVTPDRDTPIVSETTMPTSPESTEPRIAAGAPKPAPSCGCFPGGTTRREWILDERTRNVGRQGVAQARAILRKHQPPQPVDAWSQAS